MPFRRKPPARVVEEILGFAAQYKILDFVAVDDIIDRGHIRDLSAAVERGSLRSGDLLRNEGKPQKT